MSPSRTGANNERMAKLSVSIIQVSESKRTSKVEHRTPNDFAMSDVEIHPTAIVDSKATLGAGTIVGPYCIIAADVLLGEKCSLQHHVTLAGPMRAGRENKFYAYCSIGQQTQDLKYAGEPTYLEIGDGNTFREFCTVNRSTKSDGITRVGNGGNFLAYSHIGHDCTVGDSVVFSNNGTLAGHVEVGDHAVMGGLTAVHQFCRIGRFAIADRRQGLCRERRRCDRI